MAQDQTQIVVEKCWLELEQFKVAAFKVFPHPETTQSNDKVALITHGYTSHKGSLLNWAARLAHGGTRCLLFDLPGHYMGSFCEVEQFEDFTQYSHHLFAKALEVACAGHSPPEQLYLMGHSLGAMLAIKAITLPKINALPHTIFAVGLGIPLEDSVHLFQSQFYQSTLQLRGQLVAPTITPDLIFPWLREEKRQLPAPSPQTQALHLITGLDDVVASPDLVEQLGQTLRKLGHRIEIHLVKSLPHHRPESATAHLASLTK